MKLEYVALLAIPVMIGLWLAMVFDVFIRPATSTQQADAARAYADTLGLHVLGVSCHGETCSIAYQANDGPRVIVATCDADFCTGAR